LNYPAVSCGVSLFRGLVFCQLLDAIQRLDERQRLICFPGLVFGLRFLRFDEFATRMRPVEDALKLTHFVR
jgi:hypothetical protein